MLRFLFLLLLVKIEAYSPEVEEVFDPESDEESYQRRYVINVANKAEECYFIPGVRRNQVINFHYVVSLLF